MIWHNISSLWLLLLIPLVAGLLWWYRHRQEKRLDRVFDRRLLSRLRVGFWARGIRLKVILILTAFSFFIVGLAGPRIGTEVRDVERRGLDLLVVLDLSRSMNAEDIRPTRLEKAKFEIQRLIEHSRGDRIGLLVFTGEAFVQSPVTQDYSALRMFLDIAETRQLPGSTTNFRAAFEKAKETYDRLEPRPEAARVMLMISDGENHGPSYNSALDELTSDGVHVFTLGIGTGGGGRIPVYDPEANHRIGYHRNAEGREVVTRLEPEALQDIARRGNGNYFEINSGTAGIDPFLSRLDELQRGEYAAEEYADYKNRYQLLLLIGLGLFIAGLLIPEAMRTGSDVIPGSPDQ